MSAKEEDTTAKDTTDQGEKKEAPYNEDQRPGMMAWVAGVITEFVGGYETAPFELVQTFEVGDKKFEERRYVADKKWVCNKQTFKMNDVKKKENTMFMSLFNYITGKNATQAKIPMTVPVSMRNQMMDDDTMEQEMCFYIDSKHQEDPPKPNNPDVYVSTRPELVVYTRTIGGFMNQAKWEKELAEMDKMIEEKGLKVDKSHYYTNGYDAPFKLWNRRNEVWRVKLQE